MLALFEALAKEDWNTTAELGGCSDALCQNLVGYTPPTEASVIDVKYGASGDQAVVKVGYRLAQSTHQELVGVSRIGDAGAGWSITNPPGSLITLDSAYYHQVEFAGHLLSAGTSHSPDRELSVTSGTPLDEDPQLIATTNRVWAPPGIYKITRKAGELLDALDFSLPLAGPPEVTDEQLASATQGHIPRMDRHVTLPPVFRPGLIEQVNQDAKAYLDVCARQRVLRPVYSDNGVQTERCQFGVYDPSYDDRPCPSCTKNVRWTITKYPTISLSVNRVRLHEFSEKYVEKGGIADSTAGGIDVSFDQKTNDTGAWRHITLHFVLHVSGTVEADGGGFVFHPNPG